MRKNDIERDRTNRNHTKAEENRKQHGPRRGFNAAASMDSDCNYCCRNIATRPVPSVPPVSFFGYRGVHIAISTLLSTTHSKGKQENGNLAKREKGNGSIPYQGMIFIKTASFPGSPPFLHKGVYCCSPVTPQLPARRSRHQRERAKRISLTGTRYIRSRATAPMSHPFSFRAPFPDISFVLWLKTYARRLYVRSPSYRSSRSRMTHVPGC